MDLKKYSAVTVSHPTKMGSFDIPLVSSKSESNRALIIQALKGEGIELHNLSEARDTQTMQRLISAEGAEWDVLDAGTTMRFLTAFAAVTSKNVTLTGTARMCQRPIGILADALTALGATLEFERKEGYPPLSIKGSFTQVRDKIAIRGDVSSQYISALLMIAPVLPKGLALNLVPPVNSRPYIDMTLQLMERFGVKSEWKGNSVTICSQVYQSGTYTIESDWSGASYWYSIVALSEGISVNLQNLREQSLQGDRAIVAIMEQLGVKSTFHEKGVLLEKKPSMSHLDYDFTHCPDLAQTVAVVCAAKSISAKMTGLQSLRIKETDRITALVNELGKLGCPLRSIGDDVIELPNTGLKPNGQSVETYDDHRMAMAFAPLGLLSVIRIKNPVVVEKSYPRYWEDLQKAGFDMSFE